MTLEALLGLEVSDKEKIDEIARACGFPLETPEDAERVHHLASEIIGIKNAEIAAIREAALDAIDTARTDGVEAGLKVAHKGE